MSAGSQAPTTSVSQCQPVSLLRFHRVANSLKQNAANHAPNFDWGAPVPHSAPECPCVHVCSHCICISYKCIQIMRIYQENSMNCKWCGSCSCELYARVCVQVCVCVCVCAEVFCPTTHCCSAVACYNNKPRGRPENAHRCVSKGMQKGLVRVTW